MKRKRFFKYSLLTAAVFIIASFVFLFSTISINAKPSLNSQVSAATLDAPAVPSPPVSPADSQYQDNTPQYNAELTSLINKWALNQPNQWGISVKGLVGTNIEANYQGDTTFFSASIYKLYMVYVLSQKVPTSKWSMKTPGDSRSVDDCVTAMLERSDNACGTAISNWLGWVKAQSFINKAGYNHTILNHVPVRTTANDTLKFMDDLYSGRTFNEELRDRIISNMQHSVFRQGIVAGCSDCSVANKTGNLNGFNNDAAIITVDGKTFVVSIFSKGGSFRQIADITKQIQQFIRSH